MRRVVLVTGASGHLGYNLVRELSAHGYEVRAGVRSAADRDRTAALRALDVELVDADLLQPATVVRAMRGVSGVFHAAAVLKFWAKDPQREIIDPTVDGALTVLRAAADAGVATVVFTSSLAAVGIRGGERRALTEADWNDRPVTAYSIAKTKAERRAWEFAAETGMRLIAMNPASIIGPGVFRHTPVTQMVEYVIRGRLPFVLPADTSYVDVRDVARVQRLALESETASGRYLLASEMVPMREFVRMIGAVDPNIRIPRWVLPIRLLPALILADSLANRLLGTERQLTREMVEEFAGDQLPSATTKAERELGWKPRPVSQSVADTVEWVKRHFIARSG